MTTSKKLILVQYKGIPDYELDKKIGALADKLGLEYDGTGYDLFTKTREHFIYSSSITKVTQFKLAIKKLGHKLKVTS